MDTFISSHSSFILFFKKKIKVTIENEFKYINNATLVTLLEIIISYETNKIGNKDQGKRNKSAMSV